MFHGSMVAIVTPMHENGEVDYDSLTKLIEWHIESGTDAIVACGTTGESATLSDKEKLAVIRHVEHTVNERIPVIAGTYSTETKQAVELTRQAMEAGADAALIMTPAYVKPTQEGLYQHYKAIAEQVAIPQIVYNVPGRTGCDILPETLERLSHLSNIVGIKEATGSMQRLADIKQLCGDRLDIYSGDDSSCKEFMLQGGKGVISVTANIAPKLFKELCDAALSGDASKAEQHNNQLLGLYEKLFVEANPIPAKWALMHMGKIPAGIRLPLTPLAKQFHSIVAEALDNAGVTQ